MPRFFLLSVLVALFCVNGAQSVHLRGNEDLDARSNNTPMNAVKMREIFAQFIAAKQSFMLSEDCQSDDLDQWFSYEVTMFTDKSEFIKAPSGEIRETFHNHCVGLKKKYGKFLGFEYEVHYFEGNYKDGRAEFHGKTLTKSQFSGGTIEEHERFTYVLNLEDNHEKKGLFSKPHWKIMHLHTSQPE